jgi:type IV pilus assembly protein PilP
MTRVRLLLVGSVISVATVAAAQQPAPKPESPAQQPQPVETAKPSPGGAAQQPAPPPPSAGYTYDPQGRRDPFVSLLARGSDPRSKGSRPAGLPGLLINEVTVKGIVRDRSGYIAMIQGPDAKTFIVRSGEKLMDGTVKAITADSVVFSQDVNDPLSMVKQKEIRKTVRSATGGRG